MLLCYTLRVLHTLSFFTTFQQFGSLASDDDDDGPWKKRFRSRSVWSTRRLMEKYIIFFLCVILRVSSFNSRFSAVLSCGRLFFSSSYSSIHFFLRFISTSTPTLSPRRRRRRLLMKIQ